MTCAQRGRPEGREERRRRWIERLEKRRQRERERAEGASLFFAFPFEARRNYVQRGEAVINAILLREGSFLYLSWCIELKLLNQRISCNISYNSS